MTRILLHGYKGKLGGAILALAQQNKDVEIVAGIDINADDFAFPTFNDINACNVQADVIIDCSTASAVDSLLDYAVKTNTPVLVCTTGLKPETSEHLIEASKSVGVFKSANMSLGVNLVAAMLEKVSKLLDSSGFDIEIIEKHHNQKIDAPSGTALLLADAVNSALDGKLEYVYDRSDKSQKRSRNELGIHSLRGGTIVGEHSVIYAGQDEVIEIKHNAYSKDVFAVGALQAAIFMHRKVNGLYSMKDLIGLL